MYWVKICFVTSRTLQKKNYSAAEGQLTAKRTTETLESIRSEEKFDLFWEKVKSLAAEVDGMTLSYQGKEKRFDDESAQENAIGVQKICIEESTSNLLIFWYKLDLINLAIGCIAAWNPS